MKCQAKQYMDRGPKGKLEIQSRERLSSGTSITLMITGSSRICSHQ